MRPFLLPLFSIWIYLDTVQSISEPEFEDRMGNGGYFVHLRWLHAFQNEQRCVTLKQSSTWDDEVYVVATRNADGKYTALDRMRKEVFKPFFEAWTNAVPQSQIERGIEEAPCAK